MLFLRVVFGLRAFVFLYEPGEPAGGTGERLYLGGILFPDGYLHVTDNWLERRKGDEKGF